MTEQGGPTQVVITGVDMKFGSLVNLMIKIAIASIPAGIIISVISLIFFLVLSGLLAAFGYAVGW